MAHRPARLALVRARGMTPLENLDEILTRASSAFERGDYRACRRLIAPLRVRGVNSDQIPRDKRDRAHELEERAFPERLTWVIGLISAALLIGIFAYYVFGASAWFS